MTHIPWLFTKYNIHLHLAAFILKFHLLNQVKLANICLFELGVAYFSLHLCQ